MSDLEKPIYWDAHSECYVDNNDNLFIVDYTPDGDVSMEFNTQEEFWAWYNR